jgi:hypothetical protein
VFSIVSDESAAYVNFTNLTWFYYPLTYYGNKKEETDAELLELAIIELRAFSIVISKLLSRSVDLEHLKVTVPQLEIKANFRSFCPKC